MARYLLRLIAVISAIALLVPVVFGQETTAGLQGVVKDASGAVVAKAVVEVSSPSLIGMKVLETDAGGYYRFANLPPGTYTLTVSAQNFRTVKQENITLTAGRLPTIDVVLQVGMAAEVVEVSGEAPLVDVTQSKVQTNLTADVLAETPKGRSFQSVIQFAPGARYEPMQAPAATLSGISGNRNGVQNAGNGYQIDGASNTENSYLVEGLETASVFDGASSANVPMEFIQEVQIKTSGFEAEHGGALGGVVNVIQKRGSNAWHGSVFTYYQGDAFDAAPDRWLRGNPSTSSSTKTRTDQTPEYYQRNKDHYRIVEPGVELGGYLLKDKLWVFGSTVPRIAQYSRTVNFASTAPVPGVRTFHQNVNTYYSLARVDFLATQKIRLFGSWQYGYERGTGTAFPSPDSPYGQVNSSRTSNVDNFNGDIGYVAPNVIYNLGADITINPNLVATTRFGYFFQDYQSRGVPVGIRYMYANTNYSYSANSATNANAAFVALDGTSHIPSQFYATTGWSNIGANRQTAFDKLYRWQFNQDFAYFHRGFGGTHNLKVGYAFSRNRINTQSNVYKDSLTYVGYGLPYTGKIQTGKDNCATIISQNITRYGGGDPTKIAAITAAGCQGLFGTVNITDYGQSGNVLQWNHALYLQDAWTIGHGITINAGLRAEKEIIPSFDPRPGFLGVTFDWPKKLAPRLGAAWDVLGNGKLKAYGSFGYFYQVMNLQLPRGQWGGNYWHDCVYALDVADFTQIIPQRDASGHYCPPGGTTLANGTFPANGLRFIENYNYRAQANDPTAPGSLGPTGRIDPNLDPMRQHEMVIGADYELKPTIGLELRYSRKRLDRAIEDAGIITSDGEMYYDVNPGYHANATIPSFVCTGCPPNPKAARNYDGLEARLTYKGTGKWFGAFSYTYSRYYGNYAGLTSTDQADSNLTGGRNGANSDRAFDEPFMSFDSHGKLIDGPLSTDRPHTFKAYGYYKLKWWKMETLLGAFQQFYSGVPLSSYMSVWGAPVYVEGRGKWVDLTRDSTGNWVAGKVYDRRTPTFSQTDFNMAHNMHVSKSNERLMLGVEANISNLFNQHSPLDYNSNMIASSGGAEIHPFDCNMAGITCLATNKAGFEYKNLLSGFDYIAQANAGPCGTKPYAGPCNSTPIILNGQYGMPYLFQNPRSFRFKLRFTF